MYQKQHYRFVSFIYFLLIKIIILLQNKKSCYTYDTSKQCHTTQFASVKSNVSSMKLPKYFKSNYIVLCFYPQKTKQLSTRSIYYVLPICKIHSFNGDHFWFDKCFILVEKKSNEFLFLTKPKNITNDTCCVTAYANTQSTLSGQIASNLISTFTLN